MCLNKLRLPCHPRATVMQQGPPGTAKADLCYIPWKQNFWLTTKGNLSNDDGDGNKKGKKAIELYY